jgi:hypothetical protein
MPQAEFRSLLPSDLASGGVAIGAERISILPRSAAAHGACPRLPHTLPRVDEVDQPRAEEFGLLGRRDFGFSVLLRGDAPTEPRRRGAFNPMPMSQGVRALQTGTLQSQIFPRVRKPRTFAASSIVHGRSDRLVRDLGVALGGRPAAALAPRLMLPVGKDTLL